MGYKRLGHRAQTHPIQSVGFVFVSFVFFVVISSAFAQNTPAVRFRLPLDADSPNHYFFDDDPEPNACLSWNCKTSNDLDCVNGIEDHTYDGHPGTDFSFRGVKGATVLAAADGTLIEKEDGHPDGCHPCADPCQPPYPPGNRCQAPGNGNFVRLDHGDGVTTVYLHLEAESPTAQPIGSFIACGEVIGTVGTSGNSSGPHLHFDVQDNYTHKDPYAWTGVAYDPQTATCRIDQRAWVDQCGHNSPAARCDPTRELIRNGSFAFDNPPAEDSWRRIGDFHFDTRDYQACKNQGPHYAKTCPGFAYLGNQNGSLGNVAGVLEQDVSIPPGSRWATLVYWYSLETETQTSGSPFIWVQIKDESSQVLQTLRAYADTSSDVTAGEYKREAFDLSSYAGQTVRLSFSGDTTQPLPTLFKVDSVSLKAGLEAPGTSECNDGDLCTTGDKCVGCGDTQKCAGTPVACNNGLFCDGIETCVVAAPRTSREATFDCSAI